MVASHSNLIPLIVLECLPIFVVKKSGNLEYRYTIICRQCRSPTILQEGGVYCMRLIALLWKMWSVPHYQCRNAKLKSSSKRKIEVEVTRSQKNEYCSWDSAGMATFGKLPWFLIFSDSIFKTPLCNKFVPKRGFLLETWKFSNVNCSSANGPTPRALPRTVEVLRFFTYLQQTSVHGKFWIIKSLRGHTSCVFISFHAYLTFHAHLTTVFTVLDPFMILAIGFCTLPRGHYLLALNFESDTVRAKRSTPPRHHYRVLKA